MKVVLSSKLVSQLQKLSQNDKDLSEKIHKQLKILSEDSRHPSLRTHKLSGELKNLWSISVTPKIRMTYIIDGEAALFTKLGTHDEVYRK